MKKDRKSILSNMIKDAKKEGEPITHEKSEKPFFEKNEDLKGKGGPGMMNLREKMSALPGQGGPGKKYKKIGKKC